jgi:hypothetical protein
VSVLDINFLYSGNNPAQVKFDGDRFILVEKRDDWWGETIEFGVADQPQGPYTNVGNVEQPLKMGDATNTYFAAWLPWRDANGDHIFSLGHNMWDGSQTHSNLWVYRPTFHTYPI